ncbi:Cell division protein FtsZ [Salinivirga cyanobacteriivorans]|uniref:Cell division protein FtsZ n=1 Tax=Salinivirga cyanobacteriivorans TaxID=1307839 RepID=A0A0S2HYX8_9BACT|nr:cell division protein FtsZ [Salinivirga cyanobacteriivorans]ALO15170.1 Cell division protein FtsZ [Salinivirga cyanobacteriivorans]
MNDDNLMQFDLPQNRSSIIKVIGVGGGGGNAVNYMYEQGINEVDFVVCNTDAQDLAKSPIPVKVQLGESLTGGRGAGSKPDKGRQAAIESLEQLSEILESNTKMVFITAGMGGGTGTGAAPVIAEEAQKKGILTIGIVTIPFLFEGKRRINQAVEGIERMKEHVDSLLVINNEKLREIYGDSSALKAFSHADDILSTAAKGIAEIITVEGVVNVDFEDVFTVMHKSGVALMGRASAEGEDRAVKAIQKALTSPLLNNNDIHGSKNMLLHITSGAEEVTMDEIGQITDYAQDEAGQNADVIWGLSADPQLGDKVAVTVIATGFDTDVIPEIYAKRADRIEKVTLKPDPGEETYDNAQDEQTSASDQKEEHLLEIEDAPEREEDEIAFVPENSGNEKQQDPDGRERKKANTLWDTKKLEELEAVPAYIRRKTKLSGNKTTDDSEEVSRYTLSDDEDGPDINTDNSYLNNNVD